MRNALSTLALILIVVGAGCAKRVDIEKVPVGAEVDVTRQDGGVVRGTLADHDGQGVRLNVGATQRLLPRDQIADVRVVRGDDASPAPLPAIAKFREFTVPAGTKLVVRLDGAVSSDSSRVDDPVEATLAEPVIVGHTDVLPVGSIVRGEVTSVARAGNVKGRANLALEFRSLSVAERGDQYPIGAHVAEIAPATKAKDAEKIAAPAAGGALIGALLGGKKGAAIGALVGGGTGTAIVLSTPGEELHLSRGTTLSLRLEQPIDVRVPITRGEGRP